MTTLTWLLLGLLVIETVLLAWFWSKARTQDRALDAFGRLVDDLIDEANGDAPDDASEPASGGCQCLHLPLLRERDT